MSDSRPPIMGGQSTGINLSPSHLPQRRSRDTVSPAASFNGNRSEVSALEEDSNGAELVQGQPQRTSAGSNQPTRASSSAGSQYLSALAQAQTMPPTGSFGQDPQPESTAVAASAAQPYSSSAGLATGPIVITDANTCFRSFDGLSHPRYHCVHNGVNDNRARFGSFANRIGTLDQNDVLRTINPGLLSPPAVASRINDLLRSIVELHNEIASIVDYGEESPVFGGDGFTEQPISRGQSAGERQMAIDSRIVQVRDRIADLSDALPSQSIARGNDSTSARAITPVSAAGLSSSEQATPPRPGAHCSPRTVAGYPRVTRNVIREDRPSSGRSSQAHEDAGRPVRQQNVGGNIRNPLSQADEDAITQVPRERSEGSARDPQSQQHVGPAPGQGLEGSTMSSQHPGGPPGGRRARVPPLEQRRLPAARPQQAGQHGPQAPRPVQDPPVRQAVPLPNQNSDTETAAGCSFPCLSPRRCTQQSGNLHAS